MKQSLPDSPEGVAFALFCLILSAQPGWVTGSAAKPYLLGLFAECLALIYGAEQEDRSQAIH